jgi:hypothetical protein
MDPTRQPLPQATAPPISRKKRPIRHGVYVNSHDAIKVRGGRVSYLVRKVIEQMPSLEQFLPTVRKWAELEVIRRAPFASIVQSDVLHVNHVVGGKIEEDWGVDAFWPAGNQEAASRGWATR